MLGGGGTAGEPADEIHHPNLLVTLTTPLVPFQSSSLFPPLPVILPTDHPPPTSPPLPGFLHIRFLSFLSSSIHSCYLPHISSPRTFILPTPLLPFLSISHPHFVLFQSSSSYTCSHSCHSPYTFSLLPVILYTFLSSYTHLFTPPCHPSYIFAPLPVLIPTHFILFLSFSSYISSLFCHPPHTSPPLLSCSPNLSSSSCHFLPLVILHTCLSSFVHLSSPSCHPSYTFDPLSVILPTHFVLFLSFFSYISSLFCHPPHTFPPFLSCSPNLSSSSCHLLPPYSLSYCHSSHPATAYIPVFLFTLPFPPFILSFLSYSLPSQFFSPPSHPCYHLIIPSLLLSSLPFLPSSSHHTSFFSFAPSFSSFPVIS